MKKNIILSLLSFTAIALSSCSEDTPSESSSAANATSDIVGINVSSTITRGVDVTTTTLEESSGVKLHVVDSGKGDDLTSGAYDFVADDSDWSQSASTPLIWDDIDFPAVFYSMHDGTSQSLTSDINSSTLDYEVNGDSSDHRDLVFHVSQLNAIPTGGTINLYHKHALSKIHIYAATGSSILYVARVRLVNVDDQGIVEIVPVSATKLTTDGISWSSQQSDGQAYSYFYIDDEAYTPLQSTTSESMILNPDTDAPLMIIPQETTATSAEQIESGLANVTGSYIEVIYYLTDSAGEPLAGYSSVAVRDDADEYDEDSKTKTLHVMGAFPLKYDFEVNKEYDITIGIGSDGSSGGLLLADYYVDKDGDPVKLKRLDCITSTEEEIPEIDLGDEILGDSSDELDINVTASNWDDGDDITL